MRDKNIKDPQEKVIGRNDTKMKIFEKSKSRIYISNNFRGKKSEGR